MRNKWLRIELLQRKTHFQKRYCEAYDRHQAGEVDVLFPIGSYQLAMQGWVCCEPSPVLE
jgi:hypothetical protein